MSYATLGATGLTVSRLCLGCMPFSRTRQLPWFLDESDARAVIRSALDAGINFFDTADMYSLGESEEVTGQILRDLVRRDQVVVATKVGMPMGPSPTQRGLTRSHIMEGIDHSLRRLGMEYVDLYIAHEWDHTTPIAETLEAFHDVVRAGKARYVGASSMNASQLAEMLVLADRHGWTRFVSMQNHYNLLRREDELDLIPLCINQRVALTPFSPLARGFLAGNRRQGGGQTLRAQVDERAHRLYYREEDFAVARQVEKIADARALDPVQVALAWVLSRPGITSPVVGVRTPEQLAGLIAAQEIVLDSEEEASLSMFPNVGF